MLIDYSTGGELLSYIIWDRTFYPNNGDGDNGFIGNKIQNCKLNFTINFQNIYTYGGGTKYISPKKFRIIIYKIRYVNGFDVADIRRIPYGSAPTTPPMCPGIPYKYSDFHNSSLMHKDITIIDDFKLEFRPHLLDGPQTYTQEATYNLDASSVYGLPIKSKTYNVNMGSAVFDTQDATILTHGYSLYCHILPEDQLTTYHTIGIGQGSPQRWTHMMEINH